ncbi:TPA: opacity family porin, partial [Neisseria gonorrhoeae]
NKYSVNIKELLRRNNITSGGNQLNIKHQKTEHQENGTFHAVSSLGLSAVYDFKLNDKFKPYIGVRVGYGHVRHGIDSTKKITGTLTAYPDAADAGTTVYPDGHPQKNTYQKS